ncbi:MAG: hypothetical protein ABR503_07560 [Chitinophagaceae bacterium]
MLKRIVYLTTFIFLSFNYTIAQKDKTTVDSATYYNDLFSELDNFFDSVTSPRNMFLINIGVGNSYLNYQSPSSQLLRTDRKMTYSPSIGFFHKNGLGINISAAIVKDQGDFTPFQYILTGSYDYLHSDKFNGGISFSHFFTKDSLPFYTSPLQNEASVYFTYKDSWIRPSLTASYGWGSFTSYEDRKEYIKKLRLRKNGVTRVQTTETVSDFSVTASVRHDFYWLNVIIKKGVLRLTPKITFTSGTQKFGFNQISNSYAATRLAGNRVMYNSENNNLDDELRFQPLSLAAFVKPELSFGSFFIQSQLAFDYYFPADSKNMTTNFSVNLGIIF